MTNAQNATYRITGEQVQVCKTDLKHTWHDANDFTKQYREQDLLFNSLNHEQNRENAQVL